MLARLEALATRDRSASSSGTKNSHTSNQELAEELNKPIIRKFTKRKVHLPYLRDNIWDADLLDMEFSKFDTGNRFFSCVIDFFSKYAWIILLNNKR